MEDIKLPTRIEEAFDFSTSEVLAWEKAAIKKAYDEKRLSLNPRWHAGQRALERELTVRDVYNCVLHGKAKVKDPIPWDPEEKRVRKPGINYDGNSLTMMVTR